MMLLKDACKTRSLGHQLPGDLVGNGELRNMQGTTLGDGAPNHGVQFPPTRIPDSCGFAPAEREFTPLNDYLY
eukprot:4289114-Amphidinium_carterae.1